MKTELWSYSRILIRPGREGPAYNVNAAKKTAKEKNNFFIY